MTPQVTAQCPLLMLMLLLLLLSVKLLLLLLLSFSRPVQTDSTPKVAVVLVQGQALSRLNIYGEACTSPALSQFDSERHRLVFPFFAGTGRSKP